MLSIWAGKKKLSFDKELKQSVSKDRTILTLLVQHGIKFLIA